MSDPLSKSRIERLGQRLVGADAPADADLQVLRELLLARSNALEVAIARVRGDLQLAPTSRIKNTGTILDKLRRSGGSGLKSMQDLAGMRVVGTFDRRGQDEVVARVRDLFAGEARKPKIVDRRVAPMHGYAAVHVIVFPDDSPIEIQVRTAWQHEWAELFEKLADLVGRGIRYGEPPRRWWSSEEFNAMDATHRRLVLAKYEVGVLVVDIALAIAEMIDVVETGEDVATDNPELEVHRRSVDRGLVDFRAAVERLQRL